VIVQDPYEFVVPAIQADDWIASAKADVTVWRPMDSRCILELLDIGLGA
jgi:hypothetical protein